LNYFLDAVQLRIFESLKYERGYYLIKMDGACRKYRIGSKKEPEAQQWLDVLRSTLNATRNVSVVSKPAFSPIESIAPIIPVVSIPVELHKLGSLLVSIVNRTDGNQICSHANVLKGMLLVLLPV
jgi:hypothetical protein